MSESMITRCPKCSTTFRVTQEVLNMAKGKVRCGQCFHIFTAPGRLIAAHSVTEHRKDEHISCGGVLVGQSSDRQWGMTISTETYKPSYRSAVLTAC